MPPQSNSNKNTLENINNVIRGLSLIGILWVVNTTNDNGTNLLLLANEMKHVKENQTEIKKDLTEKMKDRFTGYDGGLLKAELEVDIKGVEDDLKQHIFRGER